MAAAPPPLDALGSWSQAVTAERQAVVDELNLAMLFLGDARIDILSPASSPVLEAGDARHLAVGVTPLGSLTAPATAALLCRILHDLRIPAVRIERDARGLRLMCRYGPSGETGRPLSEWTLELRATVATAAPSPSGEHRG